jgi:hypothetical protein
MPEDLKKEDAFKKVLKTYEQHLKGQISYEDLRKQNHSQKELLQEKIPQSKNQNFLKEIEKEYRRDEPPLETRTQNQTSFFSKKPSPYTYVQAKEEKIEESPIYASSKKPSKVLYERSQKEKPQFKEELQEPFKEEPSEILQNSSMLSGLTDLIDRKAVEHEQYRDQKKEQRHKAIDEEDLSSSDDEDGEGNWAEKGLKNNYRKINQLMKDRKGILLDEQLERHPEHFAVVEAMEKLIADKKRHEKHRDYVLKRQKKGETYDENVLKDIEKNIKATKNLIAEEQEGYQNVLKKYDQIPPDSEDTKEAIKLRASPTALNKASEARTAIRSSKRMQKTLERIQDLLATTNTGPLIGRLKNLSPSFKSPKENTIEALVNNLILEKHQTMKNIPRSEQFLKRLEQTKASLQNYPEANEATLNELKEHYKDAAANARSTLHALGYDDNDIDHMIQEAGEKESQKKDPEKAVDWWNRGDRKK